MQYLSVCLSLPFSLSHYLGPRPTIRPDSVPDLGALQIIYLLTYLLSPLQHVAQHAAARLHVSLYMNM